MIGGRLGHIFIYGDGYYFSHLSEMLQVRKGGMSFIGSMIGVSVAFLVFKKIKKLTWTEFLLVFDCILAIVPFGIMIGRVGNFLNQELYGTVVPSGFVSAIGYPLFSILHDLHIFHVYSAVDDALRINTNFLSIFFEGLVILIITLTIVRHRLKKKTYHAGQIAGAFLVAYSAIRFALEYFRSDSQDEFVGILTKSQRFFVFFFVLGVGFFLRQLYKTKTHK
jgi:phosphatidylglycerol:prolipoprotein diacylglycerol transferase